MERSWLPRSQPSLCFLPIPLYLKKLRTRCSALVEVGDPPFNKPAPVDYFCSEMILWGLEELMLCPCTDVSDLQFPLRLLLKWPLSEDALRGVWLRGGHLATRKPTLEPGEKSEQEATWGSADALEWSLLGPSRPTLLPAKGRATNNPNSRSRRGPSQNFWPRELFKVTEFREVWYIALYN